MKESDTIQWDKTPWHKSNYGDIWLSKCGRFMCGWEYFDCTCWAFSINIETGVKAGGVPANLVKGRRGH